VAPACEKIQILLYVLRGCKRQFFKRASPRDENDNRLPRRSFRALRDDCVTRL
jgi:hypothetical protein